MNNGHPLFAGTSTREETARRIGEQSAQNESIENLALNRSLGRFHRRDKQIANTLGHEATARGRAVKDSCLPALISHLKEHRPRGGLRSHLWKVLKRVEPGRLAEAILSGAIHILGLIGDGDRDATLRAAMEQIGRNIERECWSARLLKKKGAGYARLDWDTKQLHYAGGWGVDMLMKAVPGMFEIVLEAEKPRKEERENYLVLSDKAEGIADDALRACVRNNPYHMPTFAPPPPWRSVVRDGDWGERQLLVRCEPNSLKMGAVRKALIRKSKPWLDALHKLESVPFRINEPMLRFVQRSYDLATAESPRGLDFLFHAATIRAWRWDLETNKFRHPIIANEGDRNKGTDHAFRTDMATAEALLKRAFYVPMNFDSRGRVNAIPSFKFASGDHNRSLCLSSTRASHSASAGFIGSRCM